MKQDSWGLGVLNKPSWLETIILFMVLLSIIDIVPSLVAPYELNVFSPCVLTFLPLRRFFFRAIYILKKGALLGKKRGVFGTLGGMKYSG